MKPKSLGVKETESLPGRYQDDLLGHRWVTEYWERQNRLCRHGAEGFSSVEKQWEEKEMMGKHRTVSEKEKNL